MLLMTSGCGVNGGTLIPPRGAPLPGQKAQGRYWAAAKDESLSALWKASAMAVAVSGHAKSVQRHAPGCGQDQL